MTSLHPHQQNSLLHANIEKVNLKYLRKAFKLLLLCCFFMLVSYVGESKAQFSNVSEANDYCNEMQPDAKDLFLKFIIPLADKGDRDASYVLGSRYVLKEMCGQPSKPLYLEGLELWKKAARQKHIRAALDLSDYYSSNGRGKGKVRSDPVSSLKWAALAQNFNEEIANQEMTYAKNKIFIGIALSNEKSLSPEQRAEAMKLVEECSRNLSTCK
jgi:hypothetical protein